MCLKTLQQQGSTINGCTEVGFPHGCSENWDCGSDQAPLKVNKGYTGQSLSLLDTPAKWELTYLFPYSKNQRCIVWLLKYHHRATKKLHSLYSDSHENQWASF